MLKNKKVIIFDLDGTLIDSVGIWNKVDSKVIEEFSGQKIDLEIIQEERDKVISENKDGQIYEVYTQYLIDKYSINQSTQKVMSRRKEIVYEYITKTIDYKENAEKVLKRLKESGYILVLATTSARTTVDSYDKYNENLKKKAKIFDIFNLILTKDDVKEKKPSPEIYLTVLEKLNVEPEVCIVVEDSLEGVKSAKAAGIEVINIPDYYSRKNQNIIDELCDYKVGNFTQFLKMIK